MAKFRKRPVIIEAIQYLPSDKAEIESFVGVKLESKLSNETAYMAGMEPPSFILMIPTLESPHEASVGDWIIKGVQGEFYPCKPDIFEKTYEKVEEQL